MAEWLLLWLVAVVLYLVECCSWVRSGAWCCFRSVRGWRASSGSRLFGNDRGGIAFCHPLSQSGAILHCAEWPISISPGGIVHASASQGNQESTPASWSFEEITSVTSSLGDLKINGVSIRVGSDTLAADIAAHLNELRELPESKRASAIRSGIKHSLDVKDIGKIWNDFQKQTATLARTARICVCARLRRCAAGDSRARALPDMDLLARRPARPGCGERPSVVCRAQEVFQGGGFRSMGARALDRILSAVGHSSRRSNFERAVLWPAPCRRDLRDLPAAGGRIGTPRAIVRSLDCGLRTRARVVSVGVVARSGQAAGARRF